MTAAIACTATAPGIPEGMRAALQPGEIAGIVVNDSTGVPIGRAGVSLYRMPAFKAWQAAFVEWQTLSPAAEGWRPAPERPDPVVSTFSDPRGVFWFPAQASGHYVLECIAIGFLPQVDSLDSEARDGPYEFRIRMAPAVIVLND